MMYQSQFDSIEHMIKMHRIRILFINYYYEVLLSLPLADPFRSVHPDVENIVLIFGVEVPEGQFQEIERALQDNKVCINVIISGHEVVFLLNGLKLSN